MKGAFHEPCRPPRRGYASPVAAPRRRRETDASLGEAQSSNPPDQPDMINADADPLDTDVEDADLFLGLEDDDGHGDEDEDLR
jgi:hypothetical protein